MAIVCLCWVPTVGSHRELCSDGLIVILFTWLIFRHWARWFQLRSGNRAPCILRVIYGPGGHRPAALPSDIPQPTIWLHVQSSASSVFESMLPVPQVRNYNMVVSYLNSHLSLVYEICKNCIHWFNLWTWIIRCTCIVMIETVVK